MDPTEKTRNPDSKTSSTAGEIDETDYYTILGVERDATPEVIRKSYKRLAFTYHPDRGGDAEIVALFSTADA